MTTWPNHARSCVKTFRLEGGAPVFSCRELGWRIFFSGRRSYSDARPSKRRRLTTNHSASLAILCSSGRCRVKRPNSSESRSSPFLIVGTPPYPFLIYFAAGALRSERVTSAVILPSLPSFRTRGNQPLPCPLLALLYSNT